jgi:hypothetical protein
VRTKRKNIIGEKPYQRYDLEIQGNEYNSISRSSIINIINTLVLTEEEEIIIIKIRRNRNEKV